MDVLVTDPGMTTSLDNCTQELAAYGALASTTPLPPEVAHDFKRALLDYVACIQAGLSEPVVRAALDCTLDDGRAPHDGLSVAASIARLKGPGAAFVNGVRAHALDLDDGYTQGSCHPGAAIFPAAFAAARKHPTSPTRFMSAVALGYDVTLRIAATGHPTTAAHGFHNTAIAGVFGAAAAASAVAGLDAERLRHALGLAASFSGGVLEFLHDGSDAKRLHAGKAARDGVFCAELAARGISGPARALEGKFGFFNAFARGEIRQGYLLKGLGQEFLISRLYFKLYPCCRHYHAAIDATRAIVKEAALDASDIERVDIGLYGLGVQGHDQRRVHTLLEAQMSAPCAVALALLDANVTIESFRPESLGRQALQDLMLKIDTRQDALCEQLYPSVRSGVVTVHLKNGERHERRVESPKGEETNPLSDQELEEKFRSNAKGVLPAPVIDDVIRRIWQFESEGSALIEQAL